MRRRPFALAAAGMAGLALAVVPALAADQSVKVTGQNTFDPPTVTVTAGEKVTWTNVEGYHNVKFEDGQFEVPEEPTSPQYWPPEVSRRFDTPGEYRYFCEAHNSGGPGGEMRGTVVVNAPATTTTTTTTTTTPTPTPTPEPTASPTPSPTPTPEAEEPLVVTVRAARSTFCTRRSRRCRRAGVALRVETSEAVTFSGTLRRRGRRFGVIRWTSLAGESTKIFTRTRAGRLLRPGRYSLSLRVVGHPEIVLQPVSFRVRPS